MEFFFFFFLIWTGVIILTLVYDNETIYQIKHEIKNFLN
jgi:hypothetical protein